MGLSATAQQRREQPGTTSMTDEMLKEMYAL